MFIVDSDDFGFFVTILLGVIVRNIYKFEEMYIHCTLYLHTWTCDKTELVRILLHNYGS